MAIRMAVMAERKAAEARMKTRRAIWPSSSRRLRKFSEGSGGGASIGSRVASSVMGIERRRISTQSARRKRAEGAEKKRPKVLTQRAQSSDTESTEKQKPSSGGPAVKFLL